MKKATLTATLTLLAIALFGLPASGMAAAKKEWVDCKEFKGAARTSCEADPVNRKQATRPASSVFPAGATKPRAVPPATSKTRPKKQS